MRLATVEVSVRAQKDGAIEKLGGDIILELNLDQVCVDRDLVCDIATALVNRVMTDLEEWEDGE